MTIDTTRLRQLAVSDTGFVFDPISGHSFTVNPTAGRVLSLLKDGDDVDAIAARLAEEFELEGGEDLSRDVEDFLSRLRENGLLE